MLLEFGSEGNIGREKGSIKNATSHNSLSTLCQLFVLTSPTHPSLAPSYFPYRFSSFCSCHFFQTPNPPYRRMSALVHSFRITVITTTFLATFLNETTNLILFFNSRIAISSLFPDLFENFNNFRYHCKSIMMEAQNDIYSFLLRCHSGFRSRSRSWSRVFNFA